MDKYSDLAIANRRALANTIALQAEVLAAADIGTEHSRVALLLRNIQELAAITPTADEDFAHRRAMVQS